MSELENKDTAAENKNDATPVDGGDKDGQATAATPSNEQTLLEVAQGATDGEGSEPKDDKSSAQSDGVKTDEEKQKAEGAPEAYEDFKAPEGMEFQNGALDQFKEVAKELNLSQEQAQHLLDKVVPDLAQRQMESIKAQAEAWKQATISDKEIGGDNWTRSSADIARVRDKFAKNADGQFDPDILEFMQSPVGNHPGVLKLLARVGRAFGEADFPKGGTVTEKDPLVALYDKSNLK